MSAVNVSRRAFLRGSAVLGGGLVIGFTLPGCSAPPPAHRVGAAEDFAPNSFLQFSEDGTIRFYCPRDEMGQGVTTGLTTIVGEELDVDPARIRVELASAHPDYVNPGMGIQATGGSNAVNAHWLPLRQVGADTRALLLAAAAQDLSVPVETLATDDGHVVADGERHPYAHFLATAAGLAMPEASALKPAHEFRWIGAEFPRLDGLSKATGTAVYGIDVDVPGMHHAVVVRAPVFGASVLGFEAAAARAVAGVTDVLQIATGVAVVAERYWQARKAADALEIEWSDAPLSGMSTAQLQADYRAALDEAGEDAASEGDVASALAAADETLEVEFWAPFLAHAPLEPMSAVVDVRESEAEIWAGTQGPGAAVGLVARHTGIDAERITYHQTYLGGGFGRRGTLTHVAEAAQISKGAGKPIHLLWSREDDLRSGLYRPASMMRIRAGLDGDGRIAAWDAKRVGGNITPETLRNALPALAPGMPDGAIDWVVGLADTVTGGWIVDHSSIEGLHEDYDLDDFAVRHVTREHGVPLTFWRSVGHSYTAFAKESVLDELAERAGEHPADFRVRHLQRNPRMRRVVEAAGARMKAWALPAGHELGFASHGSFLTDVAQVAEVSIEDGRIRVHRVLCVLDCGTAVNPDVVRAQMEGGVMFGLTAALHGRLDLQDGRIAQSNFHDYPILRMDEAPAVEVMILDSDDHPTGVGEPGLPPIAPAVANALYRATGRRLRSLPLQEALHA